MRKIVLGGLIVVLALVLFFGFTLLFTWLFREVANSQLLRTRTPAPTFTPVLVVTESVVAVVTPETPTPMPTSTSTSFPTPTPTLVALASPTEVATVSPTATPAPAQPQAVSTVTVNVRAGPGTNYPVISALPPGVTVPIVGRNENGTWWQIQGADGSTGWVAGSVVEASNTGGVPIVAAPAPPQAPAPTSPPPPVAKPQYQYEPTGWYGDTNYGLTRFLGNISDANGNPVDGVFVEAQCGSYRIISNPSGPVGWGPFNESHTWPPGFYDLTLDTKPIVCTWTLAVVETADKENVSAYLSEKVQVETTADESIITANWRKNW
jgi:uncharacterized protein YraI